MISFTATILKFLENGEKTGWTYIEIPSHTAELLQPGNRKAFRVKGSLDKYSFTGISLLPVGEGKFIMPLNAAIRKNIGKRKGATVHVSIEADKRLFEPPVYIHECLEDEPKAKVFFFGLPKSHQRYFINWIESAKTEPTKTKRLAQAVTAWSKGHGFAEMVLVNKKNS